MAKRGLTAMKAMVIGALTGCVAVDAPVTTATPPDGVQVSAPVAGEVNPRA